LGKIIVMGSPERPPNPSGESFAPSDTRNQLAVLELYQRIAVVEKAVNSLERANSIERIEQAAQWFSSVHYLEKDVQQNTQKLNDLETRHLNETEKRLEKNMNDMGVRLGKSIHELEKFAYAIKMVGAFALSGTGVAILIYLYHHLIAPYFR
jgi:hypothetical protein